MLADRQAGTVELEEWTGCRLRAAPMCGLLRCSTTAIVRLGRRHTITADLHHTILSRRSTRLVNRPIFVPAGCRRSSLTMDLHHHGSLGNPP